MIEMKLEESLVPLRAKKMQMMRESRGQEKAPKRHGRVIYLHHRWNGEYVLRELR